MESDPQALPKLSPVADTVSGAMARENPADAIAHYERLAAHLAHRRVVDRQVAGGAVRVRQNRGRG